MKFALVLAALSSASAAIIPPLPVGPALFPTTTITRNFMVKGSIPTSTLCMPMGQFCDGVGFPFEEHPLAAKFTCYAAQKAMSQLNVVYAFTGSLEVKEDIFGNVNSVVMSTSTTAGAVGTTFTESGSATTASSLASVSTDAIAGVNVLGLIQAAAAAAGFSSATNFNAAQATSFSSTEQNSDSAAFADIHAKGTKINKFTATVNTAVSAFVEDSSTTANGSIAVSASRAYTAAIAAARVFFFGQVDSPPPEFEIAYSVASTFGQTVARAISGLTINVALTASVVDTTPGADVSFIKAVSLIPAPPSNCD